MFDIEENLKTLPDRPGVYLHKDKYGTIIYVGKASSLRKRVRQYFRSGGTADRKVAAMVSHIVRFEYIVTQTEMEALLLENTLIKRYQPHYNVMLRDDKTYPYIKVTVGERWPRLLKTRLLKSDGSKYFGPYADVGAVNRILDLLNDVYRLKRCSYETFPAGFRPCLIGHIDKCRRMCVEASDREGYLADISTLMDFLKGHSAPVLAALKEKMDTAAAEMRFEEAARYRDYMAAARTVTQKQRVELLSSGNMDIILTGGVTDAGTAQVTVFFVRDGRLTGREQHYLDAAPETTKEEVVAAFLAQYYANQTVIPKEILLESHIEGEALIEEMLTRNLGSGVKLIVPERGKKRELLMLAKNDVNISVQLLEGRLKDEREKEAALAAALRAVLGGGDSAAAAAAAPLRVEAYDISNTGGADAVGAMVVFEGSKPVRSDYRRFKIRGDVRGDDYAAMQEVLYRRLKRAEAGDPGFARLPDLFLIDGGTGHVHAAEQVLSAMGVQIPAAGMVKDDRHRTRGLVYGETEVNLKEQPALFALIGSIQEEVHRFVIEYHRGVRKSGTVRSLLDEIPGVGEKRRGALLAFFGSIDAIKNATEEELAAVPGMDKKSARAVADFFAK